MLQFLRSHDSDDSDSDAGKEVNHFRESFMEVMDDIEK